MSLPLFLPLAALLLLSALGVVLNTHPVRSAMCLVATLFLLAVFFIFLDAEFVAALQIIVYAGAIMVVFLFVIMLLNLEKDEVGRTRTGWHMTTMVSAGLFAIGLLYIVYRAGTLLPGAGMGVAAPAAFGSLEMVALRLFTVYLLPFEITGLLMLAAVVGAVVLAKKKVA
ncbi:MAG: NADH-quinone oxidoreductase subunit J [bacterium]